MKRLFTLLCTALLMAQLTSAQQDVFVISKSGGLTAYSASKVAFDEDLLSFTYGRVTEITKSSFTASFTVAFKSDEYKTLTQTPEVGICFSDINKKPTIYDCKRKQGTSFKNYTFSITDLDGGTTYYYRIYVQINDVVYYGGVQQQTTYGSKPTKINGHKFVDLALPSGILWATNNIGATTAADDGYYYAWGETEPQSSNSYSWDSYKHGTSWSNLAKYNATDEKTVLEKEDDAAYINWGSSCRMPTYDDFNEYN